MNFGSNLWSKKQDCLTPPTKQTSSCSFHATPDSPAQAQCDCLHHSQVQSVELQVSGFLEICTQHLEKFERTFLKGATFLVVVFSSCCSKSTKFWLQDQICGSCCTKETHACVRGMDLVLGIEESSAVVSRGPRKDKRRQPLLKVVCPDGIPW